MFAIVGRHPSDFLPTFRTTNLSHNRSANRRCRRLLWQRDAEPAQVRAGGGGAADFGEAAGNGAGVSAAGTPLAPSSTAANGGHPAAPATRDTEPAAAGGPTPWIDPQSNLPNAGPLDVPKRGPPETH